MEVTVNHDAMRSSEFFVSDQFYRPDKNLCYDNTCHVIVVKFTRYRVHYLLQVFLPNALTVCAAWISFTVPTEWAPARVTLCVSSLLAIILQYANVVNQIPPVGYFKSK